MTELAEGQEYSTNFIIEKFGIRFQHTVRSTTNSIDHASHIRDFMNALGDAGFMVDINEEIPDGCISTDIEGYVLSTTKSGDHLMYLYAPFLHRVLKGGRIYEDYFQHLSFDPIKGAKVWPGQAPEKEDAISKGYYNQLSTKLSIITGPGYRKKEDGTAIWEVRKFIDGTKGEFDVWAAKSKGASPPPAEEPSKPKVQQGGDMLKTVLGAIGNAATVDALSAIKVRLNKVIAEGKLGEQEAKVANQLWQAQMEELSQSSATF